MLVISPSWVGIVSNGMPVKICGNTLILPVFVPAIIPVKLNRDRIKENLVIL